MARISERRNGAVVSLQVLPDVVSRFVPIWEHQPENDTFWCEFISEPPVLGHVAVRNGTLHARKNEYHALAQGRPERVEALSIEIHHVHPLGKRHRGRFFAGVTGSRRTKQAPQHYRESARHPASKRSGAFPRSDPLPRITRAEGHDSSGMVKPSVGRDLR